MRSITGEHVAAFRMQRHHLLDSVGSTLASVCRDVGGIQAQVMSAAELSLWTRRRSTRREDVQAALWQRRELVKTTSMRMTLHLLPARDFQMYIAAMKASSMASVHRTLKRIGLAILLSSGAILFALQPARYYAGLSFRIKLLLLLILGVNAALRRTRNGLAHGVVLALWLGVIFASRAIAYF